MATLPASRLDRVSLALYVLTVLAWSTAWYPIKLQTATIAPEVSAFWRFVICSAVLWGLCLWRRDRISFSFGIHLRFMAMGLTLFCLNFLFFYQAAAYMPSGLLAVIFSLASPISLALSALMLRTPIEGRVLLGGLVGFGGVAILFAPQAAMDSAAHLLPGLALSLCGTISFCLGTVLSSTLRPRGVEVMSTTVWGTFYGMVFLGLAVLAKGHSFAIDPSPLYIASLIHVALVGSVVGLLAYLNLLRRIGAARAAYSTVLFPVIALAISTVLEDYRWSVTAILGLGLVIAGNVLVLARETPAPTRTAVTKG